MTEDEVIKALENIVNRSVPVVKKKVVVMDLDYKISADEFMKFREWLIDNGFIEMKFVGDNMLIGLFAELDYRINRVNGNDSKTYQLLYRHTKEDKTVYITYSIDDEIMIEEIIYFEKV